ncbi:MAG TPA: pyridoxamine 5'-phosphate oxidase family protein [Chloroflexota bacterium]|nr:pyridoxamine 5'-phosphate oxidase family protein [Chloroflexota bacterium]HUM69530.1 pyridoxamine 5'-phosphate oxidase family protein [Chloroflexota bacterium]
MLEAVIDKFARSECSWLGTVRPSGKPHSVPVWHVWHGGRVYVVAQETAVKTRNIQANPFVTITYPDPMDVIIIEGEARLAAGLTTVLQPHFQRKYDWDIASDEAYTAVIEITPTKIIAWNNDAGQRQTWTVEEIKSFVD